MDVTIVMIVRLRSSIADAAWEHFSPAMHDRLSVYMSSSVRASSSALPISFASRLNGPISAALRRLRGKKDADV